MTYMETNASGRGLEICEREDILRKHGARGTAIVIAADGARRIAGGNTDLCLESRLRAAKRHVRVGEVFEMTSGDWLRVRGGWVRI